MALLFLPLTEPFLHTLEVTDGLIAHIVGVVGLDQGVRPYVIVHHSATFELLRGSICRAVLVNLLLPLRCIISELSTIVL